MTRGSLLIVGGTGLLGQATLKLIRPNFDVSELRRHNSEPTEGGNVYRVDLFNTKQLAEYLTVKRTVLFFPSFSTPSESPADPRHELRVTAMALVSLIEAAALAGSVPHIVFSSTAGAMYPDSSIACDEATVPAPMSSYGLGKQISEDILRFYARVGKVTYTILRFSNLYGQPARRTVRQGAVDLFLDNAISGKTSLVWTERSSTRDYLFVDDAARAVEQILIHPDLSVNSTFNVASGLSISMGDVLSIVDDVTGGRHRYTIDKGIFSGPKNVVIDASRFRTTFAGWQKPVSIRDGVKLAWDRKLAAQGANIYATQDITAESGV